jgi:hypothetical protein
MEFIWIVLLIILVLISYWIFQKDKRKVSGILTSLAAERSGSVKHVFGSYPQLSFQYQGTDILVSSMVGGSGSGGASSSHTFAHFYDSSFPEKLYFKIQSKSMETVVKQSLDFHRIRINDSSMDKAFFIQAKHEHFIRELLTPEIQRGTMELSDGQGLEARFLTVKFFDGNAWVEKPRFDIRIPKVSTEYREYEQLIALTLLFHEQISMLRKRWA